MECETTKSTTDIAARFGRFFAGARSAVASGSTHGSLRWPVIEESRLPSAWAPTQQLNGKQATEATPESGADGDEDRWLTPVDIDARTARWCAAGTLALWAMFLALVKGCTQW